MEVQRIKSVCVPSTPKSAGNAAPIVATVCLTETSVMVIREVFASHEGGVDAAHRVPQLRREDVGLQFRRHLLKLARGDGPLDGLPALLALDVREPCGRGAPVGVWPVVEVVLASVGHQGLLSCAAAPAPGCGPEGQQRPGVEEKCTRIVAKLIAR